MLPEESRLEAGSFRLTTNDSVVAPAAGGPTEAIFFSTSNIVTVPPDAYLDIMALEVQIAAVNCPMPITSGVTNPASRFDLCMDPPGFAAGRVLLRWLVPAEPLGGTGGAGSTSITGTIGADEANLVLVPSAENDNTGGLAFYRSASYKWEGQRLTTPNTDVVAYGVYFRFEMAQLDPWESAPSFQVAWIL